MAFTNNLTGLSKLLVDQQLATMEVLQPALQKAEQSKTPLIIYLVQQQSLDAEKAGIATAQYFGLPFFDIESLNYASVPIDLLNLDIVQKKFALPLVVREKHLYLAVTDPNIPNLKEIQFTTGYDIRLIIVAADKLIRTADNLLNSQLSSTLNSIEATELDNIDIDSDEEDDKQLASTSEVDSAPIVRYINKLLLDAINKNASDIHFEPYERSYRIRFRQDGILYEVASPPLKLANYFAARLKVMANLDISERRLPQDGRFKINISKSNGIDFRLSTCPTLYGEKVVLRILSQSNELLNVEYLGMADQQKALFLDAITRPQGIILVTGPTGSGKTVTLYTALKILNNLEDNVSTVEDPIEIYLPGVNQVQVNQKIGLDFSTALRAFLRQDPDIIMVGEIRDLETAEIAVKAAQTGHLVLSTLHTNSAPETIVRLSNMGVEPFNIASSIKLIIAQRLARRLCKHCKKEEDIPKIALLSAGFQEQELGTLKLYGPNGCEKCNSGYKGRVGIYEVMPISDEMSRLIMSNGSAIDIADLAKKENIPDLWRSGLEKVRLGVTSLEELNRVIKA